MIDIDLARNILGEMFKRPLHYREFKDFVDVTVPAAGDFPEYDKLEGVDEVEECIFHKYADRILAAFQAYSHVTMGTTNTAMITAIRNKWLSTVTDLESLTAEGDSFITVPDNLSQSDRDVLFLAMVSIWPAEHEVISKALGGYHKLSTFVLRVLVNSSWHPSPNYTPIFISIIEAKRNIVDVLGYQELIGFIEKNKNRLVELGINSDFVVTSHGSFRPLTIVADKVNDYFTMIDRTGMRTGPVSTLENIWPFFEQIGIPKLTGFDIGLT